jgi:hypothetical protein
MEIVQVGLGVFTNSGGLIGPVSVVEPTDAAVDAIALQK